MSERLSRIGGWLRGIRWRGLAVDALIAIALLLVLRTWLQWDLASGPAPDFAAADLAGRPVALADYRGEPLVLHFWASWCVVCSAEQETIDAIADDHALLGVAMQSGDASQVRAHMAREGLDFRNLNDPRGQLAARYGVSAVPATFILDGDGGIRFVERGWSSELGLRARLWWLRWRGGA